MLPRMVIIFALAASLAGCRGEPRYGGGLHTAEGEYRGERQTDTEKSDGEKQTDTGASQNAQQTDTGAAGESQTSAEPYQNESQAVTSTVIPNRYAVDPIKLGEIIDRYIGRPYAGKNPDEKGYDCSELVVAVYEEYASIHLPRSTDNLFKAGRVVERGDLFFGDLVFFDTGGKGVSHVGIYVGFDEFVHSSSTNGIVISNLNEDYYQKRFLGARRVME